MRSLGIVALSAGALVVGSIGFTPPAQAVSPPAVTVSQCSPANNTVPWVLSASAVSAALGESITVTNGVGGPPLTVTTTGTDNSPAFIANGASAVFHTTAASGSLLVSGGAGCNSASITFSAGGGGSSSAASDSTPPPVMQQFGLPASGTCDAAAPAELNWAGVSSGGWGISWAQWMNNGAGGVVCSRTLVYDSGSAGWVVQA